jgi:hypothetical protein
VSKQIEIVDHSAARSPSLQGSPNDGLPKVSLFALSTNFLPSRIDFYTI